MCARACVFVRVCVVVMVVVVVGGWMDGWMGGCAGGWISPNVPRESHGLRGTNGPRGLRGLWARTVNTHLGVGRFFDCYVEAKYIGS